MKIDNIEVQRMYAISENLAGSIKKLEVASMFNKVEAAQNVMMEFYEISKIQGILINQLAHFVMVQGQEINALKERAGL